MIPVVDPSLGFLVENALTAIIIVAYLAFEIHYGRLNKLARQMDEIIIAIVALARASPDVDEEAVKQRLNGHSPDDLFVQEPVVVSRQRENEEDTDGENQV